MKKNFLFKGISAVASMILLLSSIMPTVPVFADEPEPTLKWYYIHDEASWNAAYNVVNGPLQKYYALNPDEDRWCDADGEGGNQGHYGQAVDKNEGKWPDYCVHSWQGAVNATNAKYPWAAVDLPATFNGTISFEYNGGDAIYPWGKHITRTQGYGMASIPEEFNHMAWKVDVYGDSTEKFDPSLLEVKIIPETLDYLDENEEWFYIWNEATWNTAYDIDNPDSAPGDDTSYAKTPLHRYLDRNPDEDRWCDADGEGDNPGHYGQAVDKENNGGQWPEYCVQSAQGALNAAGAKFPRVVLGDNSITPLRHEGTLVFKYKDSDKGINKYKEVSEAGRRLYWARSIPENDPEKDGLGWTEFLLANGETSFDKSKFTVLLVTDSEDVITLEKADESTPVVENEAQIGSQGYATVAEAIAAAQNDDTVEILKAGTYEIAGWPHLDNITIKKKEGVEGDVILHHAVTSDGNIIAIIDGATTFKSITLKLDGNGADTTHYFDSRVASEADKDFTITFENCTIIGTYYVNNGGEKTVFNDCTFTKEGAINPNAYNLQILAGDTDFNNCSFVNDQNRNVNIAIAAQSIDNQYEINFSNPKFSKSVTNDSDKSAIVLQEAANGLSHVELKVTSPTIMEGSTDYPTKWLGGSKFVQINRVLGEGGTPVESPTLITQCYGTENGGEVVATIDDTIIYSTPKISCNDGHHHIAANGLCEGDTVTLTVDEVPVEGTHRYGDTYTLGTNANAKENKVLATVTFNYNDGETESTTSNVEKSYTPNGWLVGETPKADGATITLEGNTDITSNYTETVVPAQFPAAPQRTNYGFQGWKNANNEVVESYDGTENITLTAEWLGDTVTLTVDEVPVEGTHRYGDTYTFPALSPKANDTATVTFVYGNGDDNTTATVTKTYTPAGWKVNGQIYQGASIELTGDITLTSNYTESITPAVFPQNPTREHYTFSGWFNGETKYTEYDTFDDIILTAKWDIDTFTVTWMNGETQLQKDENVTRGSIPTFNGTTTPTKPETSSYTYSFKGWSRDNKTIIDLTSEQITENTTYYALFTETAKQTSNGGGGGGGGGGGSSSSYSCKSLPSNAVANNTKKPSSRTDYFYDTDTSKVCSFVCKEGYEWNKSASKCEVVTTTTTGDNTKIDEQKPEENKNDTTANPQETLSDGLTTELHNAYNFAHKYGITTMPSAAEANMYSQLNRIAMAKMLSQYAINVLGKTPDTSKVVPTFSDITPELNQEYSDAVTLAYQLGIMGINIEEFRPFDPVIRAEFATALSRLLFATPDGEYEGTAQYYVNHLAKLVEEKIITNNDPLLNELRGYVMIMLMRSAQ